MYHARGAMPSARADIDGGSHERASAWNAAKQRRSHVAGPLADELSIAVVMRPRHVVCGERCRQSVDRAQKCQLNCCDQCELDISKVETRQHNVRQPPRNVAD